MRNRTIRAWILLIVLLLAVMLPACSYQPREPLVETYGDSERVSLGGDESDGLGGTGLLPEGDGIGGTGISAEGDGLGGTGIIGPITGFGSIIVNGMHIDFPAEMAVNLNGESVSTQALKIGRVVEVHAHSAEGGLVAHTIAALDAVVGPIEAINRQDASLRVLGQTVYLDRETVLFSNLSIQQALKSLKRGDILRVSGLHLANGSLVATRMEVAEADANWFVSGLVSGLTEDSFAMGGLQIMHDAAWPNGLQNGRVVQVQGAMVNGRFLGQKLWLKPDRPFNGKVARLVVQGYPRVAMYAGTLRLGNLQMGMPSEKAANGAGQEIPLIHQRVQLTAHIGRNGDVRAEKIMAIRLAPAAAIGRLLPVIKLPSIPSRDMQWDRTPDQSVPKSSVQERPSRSQHPSMGDSIRLPPTGIKPLPSVSLPPSTIDSSPRILPIMPRLPAIGTIIPTGN